MPKKGITWDAPTEAKLFAAIFRICNVKPTGAQLQELATVIGPDCTPKAITHRLAKIRGNGGTPVKNTTTASASKPSAGKKNITSAKKTGKNKASDDVSDDDEGDEEEAGGLDSPLAGVKKTPAREIKGGKRSHAEVDSGDEEAGDGVENGGVDGADGVGGKRIKAGNLEVREEAPEFEEEDGELSGALGF